MRVSKDIDMLAKAKLRLFLLATEQILVTSNIEALTESTPGHMAHADVAAVT